MHIPDGFLSPAVSTAMAVASAGAVAISLKKLKETVSTRTVPLTGMMGALIFAGQMVNFPLFVSPASGHLLGGVLASVVLGPWAGCLVITLVLLVQCALFADGGMLALGANVFNMGVIGAWGGYAVYYTLRRWLKGNSGTMIAAVIAAWISVLAASTMFCIEFACSGIPDLNLTGLFGMMAAFHSLIGIGEALITGIVLKAVLSQRPDLIYGNEAMEPNLQQSGLSSSPIRAICVGTVVALAVAGFLAPFASEYADGLEAVAQKMGFDALATETPTVLVLDDYAVPLSDNGSWFLQKLAVSLAGIGGTLAVLGIALGMGRAFNIGRPATEAGHAT